jgi:Ca2+-transporting ATPase
MQNDSTRTAHAEKTEFYRLTGRETLEALSSSEKGLTRKAAEKIRSLTGPNEIVSDVTVPKWMIFLKQFRELLVLVLIAAGTVSIAIGSYRDGAIMFIIVIINAIIGFIQEYKAGKILERLKELIQSPAKVLVDGVLTEVAQGLLVPGDIVEIEAGDKIPADIRLIECFDFRTVEFSLTGESMPREKNTNAIIDRCIISDQENMAFTGTTVATGSATGVVVRTGMSTEMGRIASMTQETATVKSTLQMSLWLPFPRHSPHR